MTKESVIEDLRNEIGKKVKDEFLLRSSDFRKDHSNLEDGKCMNDYQITRFSDITYTSCKVQIRVFEKETEWTWIDTPKLIMTQQEF